MGAEGAEGLQNKSELGTAPLIQTLGLGTQIPSKTREKLTWGYCPLAGWALAIPDSPRQGRQRQAWGMFSLGLCCPLEATMPPAAPDSTLVNMFMPTAVATAVVVAVM